MLVTRMPRDSRIAAREAAAIPFPRLETTPPVTKTYFVMNARCGVNAEVYRKTGGCLKLIFSDRAVSFAFCRSPRLPLFANGAKPWASAWRDGGRNRRTLLFRGTCKNGKCRD